MLRRLSASLRLLGWAFVMAIAVWIAAVSAADPDDTRVYPLPIALSGVGQDPTLVTAQALPTDVIVNLRAPESVWDQLLAQPDSLRALVDLSGLPAGTHSLPVQIQFDLRPVRVVEVSPASITLTLETLASRTLPVELAVNGDPAIGYQAGEAQTVPFEAIVSGPQSLVERVTHLRALLDLAGVRESLDREVALQALDENDQPVPGVSASPQSVRVTLPVVQLGGYRDVAVKVVVHGRVADGYRLTDLSVNPPVVTVFSGDPQNVIALPGYIETLPLELSGARDQIALQLGLNLPAGVTVVGEQTVQVRAGVEAITGSLTLSNKPVETDGLAANLKAVVAPVSVDVILSGPLPLLDQLTAQDVRVFVDLTGLASGRHQLTPQVEILIADINLESLLPTTVEVVISPK